MVNEAQEPDDDVLSAREEFIAPGREKTGWSRAATGFRGFRV